MTAGDRAGLPPWYVGIAPAKGLPWLVRLRWATAFLQAIGLLIVVAAPAADIPLREILWLLLIALAANVSVAVMLYAFRHGDANMRSVWLCSRNDAIANIAIILAALAVLGTGAAWPDLIVAVVIAALAIASSHSVISHALEELRAERLAASTK